MLSLPVFHQTGTPLSFMESATDLAPLMVGIDSQLLSLLILFLCKFISNRLLPQHWNVMQSEKKFGTFGKQATFVLLLGYTRLSSHRPTIPTIFSSFVGWNQYHKQKLESDRRARSFAGGFFMSPYLWSCRSVWGSCFTWIAEVTL